MKALRLRLAAEGIDVSSLAPLYEAGDEHGFRLSVSEDAEGAWEVLRGLVEQTGYWPVILGDDDELERIAEDAGYKHRKAARTLVDKSLASTGEGFMAWAFDEFLFCRQEDAKYYRTSGDEAKASEMEAVLATDDPFRFMPRGKWLRGVRPNTSVTTPYHHRTGEHLPEVFIGLAPTKVSWQVPIYLNFGGFNDCPHPDDIGTVLRYWQEKHGAEMMCERHDVLELRVARPPRKRQDALLLAREQFLFCQDIVEQGTQSLERLAAELLNATRWFFWWD
jgi:hypothetical protein